MRSNLQNWGYNVYRSALAVAEANGVQEIQFDMHPPEIPHIRTFYASNPPTRPRPPKKPGGTKPPVKEDKTKGTDFIKNTILENDQDAFVLSRLNHWLKLYQNDNILGSYSNIEDTLKALEK